MAIKADSFQGILEFIIRGYTNDVVPHVSDEIQYKIWEEWDKENKALISKFNAAGKRVLLADTGYIPVNLAETAPVLNELGTSILGIQKNPYRVWIGGLGRGLEDRYISVKLWDDKIGGSLDRRENRAGTRRMGRSHRYTIILRRTAKGTTKAKGVKGKGKNVGKAAAKKTTQGKQTKKTITIQERDTQPRYSGNAWYYWRMVEYGTHKPAGYWVQEFDSTQGKINLMTKSPNKAGKSYSPKYIPHTYLLRNATGRVFKKVANMEIDMGAVKSAMSGNYEMEIG